MNSTAISANVLPMFNGHMKLLENRKRPKLDFNLMRFFRKKYANYCARQDDIKIKKIQALKDEAYNFYLDLYLTGTKNTVDIAEFLYREGLTHCQYAENMAEMEITKIIKANRVEECYKLLKEKRNSGRTKSGKRKP